MDRMTYAEKINALIAFTAYVVQTHEDVVKTDVFKALAYAFADDVYEMPAVSEVEVDKQRKEQRLADKAALAIDIRELLDRWMKEE